MFLREALSPEELRPQELTFQAGPIKRFPAAHARWGFLLARQLLPLSEWQRRLRAHPEFSDAKFSSTAVAAQIILCACVSATTFNSEILATYKLATPLLAGSTPWCPRDREIRRTAARHRSASLSRREPTKADRPGTSRTVTSIVLGIWIQRKNRTASAHPAGARMVRQLSAAAHASGASSPRGRRQRRKITISQRRPESVAPSRKCANQHDAAGSSVSHARRHGENLFRWVARQVPVASVRNPRGTHSPVNGTLRVLPRR